jgi:glycosyltransferase involved in cell wall biosynthesis
MTNDIFIPFHKYQSVGGPTTFMQNLLAYLDARNFSYADTFQNARQVFFPVSYNENVLKKIKRRKGIVIQRLDGIYYPTKHGEQYQKLNAPIKKIYQQYSDYIIFQSEYSKAQCFHMFGAKPQEYYSLIVNGVDKNVFYPASDHGISNNRLKFVTTGNFRNIDMIEPLVQALDALQKEIDFELTIIGPVPNQNLEKFLHRSYIHYLGPKNLKEIANIIRQQHIFLYSHLNPPCPNSIIEAISCGLPVVGFASGAMKELLFFAQELLAEVSDELFQQYKDFDALKLQEKIVLAVEKYDDWKAIALANSHLYSFETCGKQYVDVFIKTAARLEHDEIGFFEKLKNLFYP